MISQTDPSIDTTLPEVANPVPVIVICVPPPDPPEIGLTLTIDGVKDARYVIWSGEVAFILSFPCITITSQGLSVASELSIGVMHLIVVDSTSVISQDWSHTVTEILFFKPESDI